MRYPFLTSALCLSLAGGLAYADEEPYEETTQTEQQPATDVQNVELFFHTDSAELSEEARDELMDLANWACRTGNAVILEGHADPRGTEEHNMKLSGRRAAAVREQLISLGVPSQKIVVSVYGEHGESRESMAEERRVTARASQSPVAAGDLVAPDEA